MDKNYSTERIYRIWDDDAGSYFEVSEDSDGIGLCTISHTYEKERTELNGMSVEEAKMLAKALSEWCYHKELENGS
jgi:hypothetical protein